MRPDPPTSRRQVIAHLGLGAGRFDALGRGEILEQATPPHPDMRDLTGGEAVNAMVRHGLGCLQQALYRVPRCFHPTPPSPRMAPRVPPQQRHADA